jgi:hypothetical protein
MRKPKTITQQQLKAIRSYVKKGYSTKRIQKSLMTRHMGIRRTVLLAEVRKVKNQKPKSNRAKYTPKKYRRTVSGYSYLPKARRQFFATRQVAVYGYARTTRHMRPYSARFEFYGSGKDAFKAVQLAYSGVVPRKERAFVTCSARDFLSNPSVYGERGIWTDNPQVES